MALSPACVREDKHAQQMYENVNTNGLVLVLLFRRTKVECGKDVLPILESKAQNLN